MTFERQVRKDARPFSNGQLSNGSHGDSKSAPLPTSSSSSSSPAERDGEGGEGEGGQRTSKAEIGDRDSPAVGVERG